MTFGWGARQVAAFLLMAVVLGAVSGFLSLSTLIRLAVDDASKEGQMITQTLLPQIMDVTRRARDPIDALATDRPIVLILKAATAHESAVVYAAICDSSGKAIAHSNAVKVGARLDMLPALPSVSGFWEPVKLIGSITRSRADYELRTPLLLSDRPFATIRVGIAGGLIRERVEQVLRRSIAAGLAQIMIAGILGFFLSKILSRRIRELAVGVAAMREGRFESRIPEAGVDEFSRLAHDLNILSAQFQKERTDRDSRINPIYETVEHLGKGIVTLGPDKEILLMNTPAARILDLDSSSSRGRRIDEILPADHPVSQLVARAYNGADGSISVDMPQSRPDEPASAAIAHQIPGLADRGGGVLIEFREAAAWKELHWLVYQSRVLSRLGQMAVGVSHEIKNPLQAISLELAVLRETRDLPREEIDSHVEAITNGIQRIHRAVIGFLTVARMRQPTYAPVQLNVVLRELHDSMVAQANLAGLELDLDLDEALPETLCDQEVLRQAVQNLTANALQALPSSSHHVVLSSRLVDSAIRISVADRGPGIRKEDLDKVSDLYFTTKPGGSGVGLALVRQAVEMHGGELIIDSVFGSGATMTLSIPVRTEGDARP